MIGRIEEIILGAFKKIVVESGGEAEVNLSRNIYFDLSLDSLDFAEAIVEIEDEFDIVMDDGDFYNCKTVQEVVDVVRKMLEK